MERMKKSTAFWMGLACLAIGAVWGFLLAPVKKGVTIYACNNGSNNRTRPEADRDSLDG